MIFKLSQKFLSKMLELTKKYRIKIMPTMFLKTFPPKYSDISMMSEPAKILISINTK